MTVVWRFSDGKPGHDNQTLGLIQALNRLVAIESHTLAPLSPIQALRGLATGQFSGAASFPTPDLILGAGHHTHLSLLAARRAKGGRTVVLMQPSLPLRCFDLCLIPEHDDPPGRENVLVTRGALNRIRPSASHDAQQGLFLIGGPSAHFDWDEERIWRQIETILAAEQGKRWTLTTSRRTPTGFLDNRYYQKADNLTVVPCAETTVDWLPEQLALAGVAWVSADSVSMVYEALTAGAAVGILDVPRRGESRVSRGLERLVEEGWVQPFQVWQRKKELSRPERPFDEAERCARWIYKRWLSH